MKPLVSILIPAFNAEKWIADTLCSALGQTWGRKEIIVVDDGSTDQTLAIARRFESEFHGLRVVAQRNQGAAAARNTAFLQSQGDYIQWLDADDLLAPDKIAAQLQALGENGSDRTLLSSAWGRFMYRPHKARFSPTQLWCDLPSMECLLRKMEGNVYMQTSSWLVSRALTVLSGPWNTALLGDDDGEYFCRVVLQSDTVRFVPQSRVYYRISGTGSLSNLAFSNQKREAHWRSMRLHIDHLLKSSSCQRSKAACVTYLQTYAHYFHPERPDILKEAQELARDLGGKLETPRFPFKYAWIEPLFGWPAARMAEVSLQQLRRSVSSNWDRFMLIVETFGGRDRFPLDLPEKAQEQRP